MLFSASLAFFVSLLCLLILLSGPVRHLALDRPNERSLHARPVPRTGGLAILAGSAVALHWLGPPERSLLLIACGLAALSLADDAYGLPAGVRLASHLAAAAAAVVVAVPQAGPLLFLGLLLGIGWLTNLYNFMDGSDGLAGGMAVAGFGSFALAAHLGGADALALACATVAAAALAFLLFNFHPARIFMGDVGSIPLGFLCGAFGASGWQAGAWPFWFPVLVFSPFAADASFTLGKRLLRREKVWQAHRDHYYQRLVRMGLGHRNTALAEYALMAASAATALAACRAAPGLQAGVLAAAFAAYAALAWWIDARWSRHIAEHAR